MVQIPPPCTDGPELPRPPAGAPAGMDRPSRWRGGGSGCAGAALPVDGPGPDGPGDRSPSLRGTPALRSGAAAESWSADGVREQQAPGRSGGGCGAGAAAGHPRLPCPAAPPPLRYRRRLRPAPDGEAAGATGPAGAHRRAAATRTQLHPVLRGDRTGEGTFGASAGALTGHRPGPGLVG